MMVRNMRGRRRATMSIVGGRVVIVGVVVDVQALQTRIVLRIVCLHLK